MEPIDVKLQGKFGSKPGEYPELRIVFPVGIPMEEGWGHTIRTELHKLVAAKVERVNWHVENDLQMTLRRQLDKGEIPPLEEYLREAGAFADLALTFLAGIVAGRKTAKEFAAISGTSVSFGSPGKAYFHHPKDSRAAVVIPYNEIATTDPAALYNQVERLKAEREASDAKAREESTVWAQTSRESAAHEGRKTRKANQELEELRAEVAMWKEAHRTGP